jgi:hypothetical protein
MKKTDDGFYQCEECDLLYLAASWAEKCEVWCREHKSCNLEISSHAIPSSKLHLSKSD